MNTSAIETGTEIVPATSLLPVDVATAKQAMTTYQELTAELLTEADWIGRPGEPDSFVKRSGWQKIATFYGVSTELRRRHVERDDDGKPLRAFALVRATAPSGRYADGEGGCGIGEPRFANYRGRQKIEHDLPATAATRATNRAISNLVGFGAVSAEEIDSDVRAGRETALPSWAQDIDEAAGERFADSLEAILFALPGTQDSGAAAFEIGRQMARFCDGAIPACVARFARLLAQATSTTGPPVPDPDTTDAAAAPDVPPQEGSA